MSTSKPASRSELKEYAKRQLGAPVIEVNVDPDQEHINNKKIRLEGIDAPEIKQQCKKPFLKISLIIGFEFYKNYFKELTRLMRKPEPRFADGGLV